MGAILAFSCRLGLEGMGQLRHVHHPLPAQHLGHAVAPPICQPGPTVRKSPGPGLGWGKMIGLKAGRGCLYSQGGWEGLAGEP